MANVLKLALCVLMSASTLGLALVIGPNSARANGELAHIEKMTGGDFCSDDSIPEIDEALNLTSTSEPIDDDKTFGTKIDHDAYRAIVIRKFDTPMHPCLRMDRRPISSIGNREAQRNLLKNSGMVNVTGFKIPIVVTRADGYSFGKAQGDRLILVRVPGGPGGADVFSSSDDVLEYNDNTITIDFFYTGNGYNLLYSKANFKTATDQLVAFLRDLRKRNERARIVLIGESLGGVISAEALNVLTDDSGSNYTVDRAILLSPALASLDKTAERIAEAAEKIPKDKRMSLYRVRASGDDYNSYGTVQKIDWLDVFNNFYDDENRSVELYDRIRRTSQTPIMIIYGGSDKRIGVERAGRFAAQKLENVELERIDGMGHQFNPYIEAADVRAILDAFLSDI